MSFTFKQYPLTLPGSGAVRLPASGEYFRIMSSTGPVDVTVEGVGTISAMETGQALKGIPFSALLFQDLSGAQNAVTVLVASSEFIDNRVVGEVSLTAPLPESGWSSNAQVIANTPLLIFAAAANPRGAILYSAEARDVSTGVLDQVYIAKTTAPTSVVDGEIIAQAFVTASADVNGGSYSISMPTPRRVNAGLGLYFISGATGAAVSLRNCRYTLL